MQKIFKILKKIDENHLTANLLSVNIGLEVGGFEKVYYYNQNRHHNILVLISYHKPTCM